MGYDIFFSYPHMDAGEVRLILKALQDSGLEVWIDRNDIQDYKSITKSIVEGLANSKVLLAYYSPNYWRSRACQVGRVIRCALQNTDDTDQTDFHGSVRIRVIRAIRVPCHPYALSAFIL